MDWTIESYDRGTDRDGEDSYETEIAFVRAADELFRGVRRGFVCARLPDGRVLDEAGVRALIATTSGGG